VQVALISAVMLVGSAVTLIAGRMVNIDFGMETANVYMVGVDLPEERYPTAAEQAAFNDRLLAELRATPGVDAARIMREAGFASFVPAGAELATPDERLPAWIVVLSESPEPIGPALIEGRAFDTSDTATSIKTALVSRELAREQWAGSSPLGQVIDVSINDAAAEQRVIVGVVGDITYDPVGMGIAGNAAIYVPLPQHVTPATRAIVRYAGGETAARSAMYEALARVDATVAPNIKLFVGCGAFAILLAITGIYGMSSNSVVLRTREIGLRRALGASNASVVGLFLRHSARQLAVGLSLSAALSIVVLVVISQGFSIGAGEVAMIGATVVTVICAIVLLSVYVSVRGAIRLDPSSALRQG
jgi:hypothetical protein